MYTIVNERTGKALSLEIADEGAARLLYGRYCDERAAAIRRNVRRQVAFSDAKNAAANAGKGYLFIGKKPARERVPAKAILAGEVLR